MRRESSGPILTTIFVDYDNIYLSLRRKSEEAAKRFAKDAGLWLRELETGRLITPTNGISPTMPRRIVMNRCYGNPVPRRNNSDNSTDMNSFPFVRHHFLRSGFEVIDCPPLTAQLKNSSDIRMVMDVRDLLGHDTYFDEFIILSGDADFTPVLHRLRAHARRTVIFANDHTAAPYTSISDGEVREADLISLLLDGRVAADAEPNSVADAAAPAELGRVPSITQIEVLRRELIGEIAALVRQAGQPVPLEALADRLVRTLGHDKTVGSGWAGAGSFRDLLSRALPGELRLSAEPPYYVFDAGLRSAETPVQIAAPIAIEPRHDAVQLTPQPMPQKPAAPAPAAAAQPLNAPLAARLGPQPHPAFATQSASQPAHGQPSNVQQSPAMPVNSAPMQAPTQGFVAAPVQAPTQGFASAPVQAPTPGLASAPVQAPTQGFATAPTQAPTQGFVAAPVQAPTQGHPLAPARQPAAMAPAAPASQPVATTQSSQMSRSDAANAIQQSIARIHEACQAPPLSPPEYRALFDAMAQEINTNGLTGTQTLVNIAARAQELGIEVRRDDIRFVLEVVSEADPWFEQGASAVLFSSRFRNFVVARCRSQGLNLSSDELDLIEAWFAGAAASDRRAAQQTAAQPAGAVQRSAPQAPVQQPTAAPLTASSNDRWWGAEDTRQSTAETGDEFPRFVRKGLRS